MVGLGFLLVIGRFMSRAGFRLYKGGTSSDGSGSITFPMKNINYHVPNGSGWVRCDRASCDRFFHFLFGPTQLDFSLLLELVLLGHFRLCPLHNACSALTNQELKHVYTKISRMNKSTSTYSNKKVNFLLKHPHDDICHHHHQPHIFLFIQTIYNS